MATHDQVVEVLTRYRERIEPVLPFDLTTGDPAVFDFSRANQELEHIPVNDTAAFTEFLFEQIVAHDPPVGIGRYNEDRLLYRHSPLFDDESEKRSVHLGIDLFVPGGTPVLAPLPARLHSFANNDRLGDYGPTIILEHHLGDVTFFSLYGHLSPGSLEPLKRKMELGAGTEFCSIGEHHENGGWPPHLHLQIITDTLGHIGDFPGVAARSQRDHWLDLCPDPNLILRIPGL